MIVQSGIEIVQLLLQLLGKYNLYHGKIQNKVFCIVRIHQESNFRKRRDLNKASKI